MPTGLDPTQIPRPASAPPATPALWRAAQDLEAAFLAVMLKEAGVGAPLPGFGGGIGEEQFGSLLRDAYATEFARTGGIGLAETIFRSLATAPVEKGPPE